MVNPLFNRQGKLLLFYFAFMLSIAGSTTFADEAIKLQVPPEKAAQILEAVQEHSACLDAAASNKGQKSVESVIDSCKVSDSRIKALLDPVTYAKIVSNVQASLAAKLGT